MKVSIRHRYIKKIPLLEVVLENKVSQPLPLIVYYHGWQSAKELSLTQARKLAKQGFRVILPDAMNHGERKTGPISMVPSITFWSSIQYNLIEFPLLLQEFYKLDLILEDRIGVGGVSMGGITTCALLTQHPEIHTAVCLMGTPAPLKYIEHVMKKAKEMEVYVPKDLPLLLSWLNEYDLSQKPETIAKRPVLFWHGTEDPKIAYQDVAEFYQSIGTEAFAENVQFWTGTGEKHLVKGELMEKVAAFFNEHLK